MIHQGGLPFFFLFFFFSFPLPAGLSLISSLPPRDGRILCLASSPNGRFRDTQSVSGSQTSRLSQEESILCVTMFEALVKIDLRR